MIAVAVWMVIGLLLATPRAGVTIEAEPELFVPPSADCREAPVSVDAYRDRLIRAGVLQHGTWQAVNRVAFEPPAGEPLSAADAETAVDAIWHFYACHNADGPLATVRLSTDHDLRESWPSIDEFDSWVARARPDGQSDPTDSDLGPITAQLAVAAVCDGVDLPDGRVGVWVTVGFVTLVGAREINRFDSHEYWYFIRDEGSWVLDGITYLGALDELDYFWDDCYAVPPR